MSGQVTGAAVSGTACGVSSSSACEASSSLATPANAPPPISPGILGLVDSPAPVPPASGGALTALPAPALPEVQLIPVCSLALNADRAAHLNQLAIETAQMLAQGGGDAAARQLEDESLTAAEMHAVLYGLQAEAIGKLETAANSTGGPGPVSTVALTAGIVRTLRTGTWQTACELLSRIKPAELVPLLMALKLSDGRIAALQTAAADGGFTGLTGALQEAKAAVTQASSPLPPEIALRARIAQLEQAIDYTNETLHEFAVKLGWRPYAELKMGEPIPEDVSYLREQLAQARALIDKGHFGEARQLTRAVHDALEAAGKTELKYEGRDKQFNEDAAEYGGKFVTAVSIAATVFGGFGLAAGLGARVLGAGSAFAPLLADAGAAASSVSASFTVASMAGGAAIAEAKPIDQALSGKHVDVASAVANAIVAAVILKYGKGWMVGSQSGLNATLNRLLNDPRALNCAKVVAWQIARAMAAGKGINTIAAGFDAMAGEIDRSIAGERLPPEERAMRILASIQAELTSTDGLGRDALVGAAVGVSLTNAAYFTPVTVPPERVVDQPAADRAIEARAGVSPSEGRSDMLEGGEPAESVIVPAVNDTVTRGKAGSYPIEYAREATGTGGQYSRDYVFSATLNADGTLELYAQVSKARKGLGFGAQFFREVHEYFTSPPPNGLGLKIAKIKSSLPADGTQTDNYKSYQSALAKYGDPTEAAFATHTGKMLLRVFGVREVRVVPRVNGAGLEYTVPAEPLPKPAGGKITKEVPIKVFEANLADGLSPAEAVQKSFAGEVARAEGFEQVASIQTGDGKVRVEFAKSGETVSPELRSLEDALISKRAEAARLASEAGAVSNAAERAFAEAQAATASGDADRARPELELAQAKAVIPPDVEKVRSLSNEVEAANRKLKDLKTEESARAVEAIQTGKVEKATPDAYRMEGARFGIWASVDAQGVMECSVDGNEGLRPALYRQAIGHFKAMGRNITGIRAQWNPGEGNTKIFLAHLGRTKPEFAEAEARQAWRIERAAFATPEGQAASGLGLTIAEVKVSRDRAGELRKVDVEFKAPR